MSGSPLDAHAASPRELRARIAAERGGAPFLLYRTGAGDEALIDLGRASDRITIGRRASNDVALEWDARVSRVHAALERVGDTWVLMDDGLSHNGTWVNGERAQRPAPARGRRHDLGRRHRGGVPRPAGRLRLLRDRLGPRSRTSASCSRPRSGAC